MSDSRSTYSIQTAVLSLQEELERLKIQALMGWPKEFRNLEWYGLKTSQRTAESCSFRAIAICRVFHLPDGSA